MIGGPGSGSPPTPHPTVPGALPGAHTGGTTETPVTTDPASTAAADATRGRDGARDARDLATTEGSREGGGATTGTTTTPRDRLRAELTRFELLRSTNPDEARRLLDGSLGDLARQVREGLRSRPPELLEDLRLLRRYYRLAIDFRNAHIPAVGDLFTGFNSTARDAHQARTREYEDGLHNVEASMRSLRDILRGTFYVAPGGHATADQVRDARVCAEISRDLGEYLYLRDDLRTWSRLMPQLGDGAVSDTDRAELYLNLLQAWGAVLDTTTGRVDRGPDAAPLEMSQDQIVAEMRRARDGIVATMGGEFESALNRLIDSDDSSGIRGLTVESLTTAVRGERNGEDLLRRAAAATDVRERRSLLMDALRQFTTLRMSGRVDDILRLLDETLPTGPERSVERMTLLSSVHSVLLGCGLSMEARVRSQIDELAQSFVTDTAMAPSLRARGLILARSFYTAAHDTAAATRLLPHMRSLRDALRTELRAEHSTLDARARAELAGTVAQLSLSLSDSLDYEVRSREDTIYDRMLAEERSRGVDVSWSFRQREIRGRAHEEALHAVREEYRRDLDRWIVATSRLREATDVPLEFRLSQCRELVLTLRSFREVRVGDAPFFTGEMVSERGTAIERIMTRVFEEYLAQPEGASEANRTMAATIVTDLGSRVHAALAEGASTADISWLSALNQSGIREFAELDQSAHLLMRDHHTPPTSEDLQACLQAAQIFSRLGLPGRVNEVIAPLRTYSDGLTGPEGAARRASLMLTISQIYSSAGMETETRDTLQAIVALGGADAPRELREAATLARGMIEMQGGNLREAATIFAELPENALAQTFLANIHSGLRGMRVAQTVAVLRAISLNFIERGRANGENMDAVERDTIAGWDEVQRYLISGECATIEDAMRRMAETGRFRHFTSGSSEFHVGSSISYFLSRVDNPGLSDADFAEACFELAGRLRGDDYMMGAGGIYQVLESDPRYRTRAHEALEGIPAEARLHGALDVARLLLAMRAGPAGLMGISMTSSASPGDVVENLAMAVVPFAAARGAAITAEGLFVARATGGTMRLVRGAEGLSVVVEAGATTTRGIRLAGFGIRAGTESLVFTTSSMALHSLLTGSTANWTLANFGREFGSMLLTFGLCHGISMATEGLGRLAARSDTLRRAGASVELGTAALRPGAARAVSVLGYAGTITGMAGLEYLNEALGLHPSEGHVPFWIRLLNSAVMDAQMRVAGSGIDAVSGGRIGTLERSVHSAYAVHDLMPALDRLGLSRRTASGELPAESAVVLRAMLARVARGESPGAIAESIDATSRRAFEGAIRDGLGVDPASAEGRQWMALLFNYVHGGERSVADIRTIMGRLPEIMSAMDRVATSAVGELGFRGRMAESVRSALIAEALQRGWTAAQFSEFSAHSGEIGDRLRSIVNGTLGPRGSRSAEGQALMARLLLRALSGAESPAQIFDRLSALAEAAPQLHTHLESGLDGLGDLSPAVRRRLSALLLLHASEEGGDNAGAIVAVVEAFSRDAARLATVIDRLRDMHTYGGAGSREALLAWAITEGLTPGALEGIARRVEEGRALLTIERGRVSVTNVAAERREAARDAVARNLREASERSRTADAEREPAPLAAAADRPALAATTEGPSETGEGGSGVRARPTPPATSASASTPGTAPASAEGEGALPERAVFIGDQVNDARELAHAAGLDENRDFLGGLATLIVTTMRGTEAGFPNAAARESFLRDQTRRARELAAAAGHGEDTALLRGLAQLVVTTMRGTERGFATPEGGERPVLPTTESLAVERHLLARLALTSRLLQVASSGPFFRALMSEIEAGRLTVDDGTLATAQAIFTDANTLRTLDRVPLSDRSLVRQALLFEILHGRLREASRAPDMIHDIREHPERFEGYTLGGAETGASRRASLLPEVSRRSPAFELLDSLGFLRGVDSDIRDWTEARDALERLADPGQPEGPLVNLARRTRGALQTVYDRAIEISRLERESPDSPRLAEARREFEAARATVAEWENNSDAWMTALDRGEGLATRSRPIFFRVSLALETMPVEYSGRFPDEGEDPRAEGRPGIRLEATETETPLQALGDRIDAIASNPPDEYELADAWLDPARGNQGERPLDAGTVTVVVRESSDIASVADAARATLERNSRLISRTPPTIISPEIVRSTNPDGSVRLELSIPGQPGVRLVVRVVDRATEARERDAAEASFERASRYEAEARPIPALRSPAREGTGTADRPRSSETPPTVPPPGRARAEGDVAVPRAPRVPSIPGADEEGTATNTPSGIRARDGAPREATSREATGEAPGTGTDGSVPSSERSTVRPGRPPVVETTAATGTEPPSPARPEPDFAPRLRGIAEGSSPLSRAARSLLERAAGLDPNSDAFRALRNDANALSEIDHLAEAETPFRALATRTRERLADLDPASPEFHRELETYREERNVRARMVIPEYGRAISDLRDFLGPLRTATRRGDNPDSPFHVEGVEARLKDPADIAAKLTRRGWTDMSDFFDLGGARVTVRSGAEAEAMLPEIQRWATEHGYEIRPEDIERIHNSRGYRAIHVNLCRRGADGSLMPVAEIQIQSTAIAEWGAVQHSLVYKNPVLDQAVPGRTGTTYRDVIGDYCRRASEYLIARENGDAGASRPSFDRGMLDGLPAETRGSFEASLDRMEALMDRYAPREEGRVAEVIPLRRPSSPPAPAARAADLPRLAEGEGVDSAPPLPTEAAGASTGPRSVRVTAADSGEAQLLPVESRTGGTAGADEYRPASVEPVSTEGDAATRRYRLRLEPASGSGEAVTYEVSHADLEHLGIPLDANGRLDASGRVPNLRLVRPSRPPEGGGPPLGALGSGIAAVGFGLATLLTPDVAHAAFGAVYDGSSTGLLTVLGVGFSVAMVLGGRGRGGPPTGPVSFTAPPSPGTMGELRFSPDTATGFYFIGRTHGHLTGDGTVSGTHATIARGTDGRWYIRDGAVDENGRRTYSRNGVAFFDPATGRTYSAPRETGNPVNEWVPLSDGMPIRIGENWYVFRAPAEPARPASPPPPSSGGAVAEANYPPPTVRRVPPPPPSPGGAYRASTAAPVSLEHPVDAEGIIYSIRGYRITDTLTGGDNTYFAHAVATEIRPDGTVQVTFETTPFTATAAGGAPGRLVLRMSAETAREHGFTDPTRPARPLILSGSTAADRARASEVLENLGSSGRLEGPSLAEELIPELPGFTADQRNLGLPLVRDEGFRNAYNEMFADASRRMAARGGGGLGEITYRIVRGADGSVRFEYDPRGSTGTAADANTIVIGRSASRLGPISDPALRAAMNLMMAGYRPGARRGEAGRTSSSVSVSRLEPGAAVPRGSSRASVASISSVRIGEERFINLSLSVTPSEGGPPHSRTLRVTPERARELGLVDARGRLVRGAEVLLSEATAGTEGNATSLDPAAFGLPIQAGSREEIDLEALGISPRSGRTRWSDSAWTDRREVDLGGVVAASDHGSSRYDHNEDRYTVIALPNGRTVLFAIDGVGGHGGGERAAAIVTAVVERVVRSGGSVEDAFSMANRALAQDNVGIPGRGLPDAVGVAVELTPRPDGNYDSRFINISDSEAIVIRLPAEPGEAVIHHTGRITTLARAMGRPDGLPFAELGDGRLARGQTIAIRTNRNANIVESTVGANLEMERTAPSEALRPGDLVVAGSDGLFENFGSYDIIVEVLQANAARDPASASRALMDEALMREYIADNADGSGPMRLTHDLYVAAYRHAHGGENPPPGWRGMYEAPEIRRPARDRDGRVIRDASGHVVMEVLRGPFRIDGELNVHASEALRVARNPDGSVRRDARGEVVLEASRSPEATLADHFKPDNVTVVVQEVGRPVREAPTPASAAAAPVVPVRPAEEASPFASAADRAPIAGTDMAFATYGDHLFHVVRGGRVVGASGNPEYVYQLRLDDAGAAAGTPRLIEVHIEVHGTEPPTPDQIQDILMGRRTGVPGTYEIREGWSMPDFIVGSRGAERRETTRIALEGIRGTMGEAEGTVDFFVTDSTPTTGSAVTTPRLTMVDPTLRPSRDGPAFVLVSSGGAWRLSVQQTETPVTVNGTRREPRDGPLELRRGDLIHIGNGEFRFDGSNLVPETTVGLRLDLPRR